MNNLSYLLALNKLPAIGPRTILKLLKRWPNLQEMFKLSAHELETAGLPQKMAQKIAAVDLSNSDKDIQWQNQSDKQHILYWGGANYPDLLKEIAAPPMILYAKGDLSVLDQTKLAIVGSRNPSVAGSENARYFAKEIASYGVSIVSGLALGVDAQAHRGCLEAGAHTVAVLGTGIDCIYPRRHQQLAEQISAQGLLLSEFPLQSKPIAAHFPQRNRIISGLAPATLVIEAALKSGSLITARMALEQNRDVLAIPGSIHNPLARGCHSLLQQGARLVTSVADVLDELNISTAPSSAVKETTKQALPKKSNFLQFIGFENTTIDQMVSRSGFSLDKVLSEIVLLELDGLISAVPGGYIRTAT